jgi:hypothetical protein
MDDWCIKGGKFVYPKREGGKFASKKGKNDGSKPRKAGMGFDAAEARLQPKKSGKAFGRPR